jgi:hypothetical protein
MSAQAEVPMPPAQVLARAQALLDALEGDSERLGASETVDGFWVETHTLGCRNHADTDPERRWEEHFEIYDEYDTDGVSLILGDPAEGIFATITPLRPA